jgi:integrase
VRREPGWQVLAAAGWQRAAVGDSDQALLDQTTRDLSEMYANICETAGVADFRFHDLRHEATCRLLQRTTLRDTDISKIRGHKDPRQLKRYASLRGSELASQLW